MIPNLDLLKTEYLLRVSPSLHFENCVKIFNRAHVLISPVCNILQQKMSAAYETCMERGIPCRMLVLKPRQVGCSTFAAQIIYHHCRNYPSRAVQIADNFSHSDNIFRILCHHAQNDIFPWKSKFEITQTRIAFDNGSLVEKDTAQNPNAGISATRQAVHASEVAKWAAAGARSGYEVMGALLNSLADVPYSVAIAESTPHGAGGWFYEQWQNASTFENFLTGQTGNGWIKIFTPWFDFPEHRLAIENPENIQMSLDERELRGQSLYQWNLRQIAWRRRVRDEKCGGNERIFNEYYPEDDVTCFLTSGSPRFDLEAICQFESFARKNFPQEGIFQEASDGEITFEISTLAWAQIWEKPIENCRYLIAADLSIGEDQSLGENSDPDCHSVLVLREGYVDSDSIEHPAMLVARIKPPTRVGFDVLAQQTDFLSKFYGRCLVAPEMNNSGMAFIERLKELNVPLYFRQKISVNGKISRFQGWQTTSANRKLIIDELAIAIRNGIHLLCPHLIGELKTFVTHSSGKEQAMPGYHDDDVMALAIGLHCLSSGTIYSLPKIPKKMPSDSYEPKLPKMTFGKW